MIKTKHIITFENKNDAESVALCSAGVSNKLVIKKTGLTKHKISYRANKVRRQMGLNKTARQQWRDGEGWLWKQFGRDIIAVAVERIQTEVTPQLVRATPEVVSVKES